MQTNNVKPLTTATVVPPWVKDPEPDTWVPLTVAARLYFRKSSVTVWQMLRDGTLEEFGFKIFSDGRSWYIKLPVAIPPEDYPKKPGSPRPHLRAYSTPRVTP